MSTPLPKYTCSQLLRVIDPESQYHQKTGEVVRMMFIRNMICILEDGVLANLTGWVYSLDIFPDPDFWAREEHLVPVPGAHPAFDIEALKTMPVRDPDQVEDEEALPA